MDSLETIDKLKGLPEDDSQVQAMVDECNALIDDYNTLIRSDNTSSSGAAPVTEQAVQARYIQIVNYKKKIEKIRLGY